MPLTISTIMSCVGVGTPYFFSKPQNAAVQRADFRLPTLFDVLQRGGTMGIGVWDQLSVKYILVRLRILPKGFIPRRVHHGEGFLNQLVHNANEMIGLRQLTITHVKEPLNKSLRASAGSFSDCRRQIPLDVAMLRLRVLFLDSRKNLSSDARIDLISDSLRMAPSSQARKSSASVNPFCARAFATDALTPRSTIP